MKPVVNEQHTLTSGQVKILTETFGEWDLYLVPKNGWTKTQILAVAKELRDALVVFASPVPLLIRELARHAKYLPPIFHNDKREKVEKDGKITFVVPEDGWQLV